VSQLRKPGGDLVLKMGEFMHNGNKSSYQQLLRVLPSAVNVKLMEVSDESCGLQSIQCASMRVILKCFRKYLES
jgi:hypothetical protein